MAINRIVERRGLSQAEVAVALEINQPKLSALLHYKLEGFSVEPLMRFLAALGQDVVGQMRRHGGNAATGKCTGRIPNPHRDAARQFPNFAPVLFQR